jgi:phospholipase/carboxylesterase
VGVTYTAAAADDSRRTEFVNDDAPLIIEPPETATSSVLWLHGLGADGHDFEPIVPALSLSRSVRFVFPHAPVRPVTINYGMRMRAWYDIFALDRLSHEDELGLRASQAAVTAMIDAEVARGIPTERIVLAGFSQGGVIALQTGLRLEQRLAGIMALSAYLPLRATVADERSAANAATSIFMAHGDQDPVLPQTLAVESRDHLRSLDYDVEWHSYPMAHMVSAEEIRDISTWLNTRFAVG